MGNPGLSNLPKITGLVNVWSFLIIISQNPSSTAVILISCFTFKETGSEKLGDLSKSKIML